MVVQGPNDGMREGERPPFDELRASGGLPSPSAVGMRILLWMQDPVAGVDELARTVQSDPALTGRLLAFANSAVSGPAEPILSVRDAAMRLGVHAVSSIALGFSLLSSNRTGRCERFDYEAFWSRSLALAVSAYEVAVLRGGRHDAYRLFTLGLLADIGRLVLAGVHGSAYAEVLAAAQRGERELRALELERFRIDHCSATRALLEHWGLPEALCEAAARYERDLPAAPSLTDAGAYVGELVVLLRAAAAIADELAADRRSRVDLFACVERACAELGVAGEELDALFDACVARWREWGELLQVETSAVPPCDELRRRALASDAAPAAPGLAAAPAGLRVLVVDGDDVVRCELAALLERAGHDVATAGTGREALAVALDIAPQILIVDRDVPDLDGLALTRSLRSCEAGRPIYVVLTDGSSAGADMVAAFEAGVDDYLTKPFEHAALLARVTAARRVVALQRQLEAHSRTHREQISRLAVLTRQLREAAMTDVLTQLPNRRYAIKRLEEQWADCARTGTPMALLVVDIDHFKRINDRYGHDVGDRVLREVASAIESVTRVGDVTARVGGEEFLVICSNVDLEGALQSAERLRAAVAERILSAGGYHGSVTVSVGVAARGPRTPNIDALLKAADRACYVAKQCGRNRVRAAGRADGEARSA